MLHFAMPATAPPPHEPAPEKPLSPALENYLTIIFRLEFACGACRASDIADAAGVARPSVTSALRMLSRLGYVRYSPYKLINLTEKGVDAGQKLAHRKLVLHDFLARVLQLPEEVCESTACDLEHVMPEEAMLRLRQFVFYMHHHEDQWRNWREEYAALAAALPLRQHAQEALGLHPLEPYGPGLDGPGLDGHGLEPGAEMPPMARLARLARTAHAPRRNGAADE